METLTLTRWELGFLRTLVGPTQAADRWGDRLEVPAADPEGELSSAGFASLLLRDLARLDGDAVVVSPQLAAVLFGLTAAERTATVVVAAEGSLEAAHVFVGSGQSLLIRPLAFGCFEVAGLGEDMSLPAVLVSFLYGAAADAVLAASVDGCDDIEVRLVGNSFEVAPGSGHVVSERADLETCLQERINNPKKPEGVSYETTSE